MSKRFGVLAVFMVAMLAPLSAMATNGDNLIGVGPISRSMGGVGIATPQDAISAVFSNPAAMCFGAFCPSNQVDFAGTAFMPNIHATISSGTGPLGSLLPRFPLTSTATLSFTRFQPWAFPTVFRNIPVGASASGPMGSPGWGWITGGAALDQPNFFGPGAPLAAGAFSNLQIMKFAPTAAYQVNDWLSLGAAFNVSYSTLDLRNGSNSGFAPGAQIGAIIKPHKDVSIGLTYTTPQDINHHNVLTGAPTSPGGPPP